MGFVGKYVPDSSRQSHALHAIFVPGLSWFRAGALINLVSKLTDNNKKIPLATKLASTVEHRDEGLNELSSNFRL